MSRLPRADTLNHQELVDRITEYLSSGGLFNPELMEHEKVRDLLIDLRRALATR